MTRPDAATEALAEAIADANNWGDMYRDLRGCAEGGPWYMAVVGAHRERVSEARRLLKCRGYVIRKARKSG